MTSAARAYVHTQLKGLAETAGRVYQQGSIITAQTAKPYLVHHFGNNTDENMYDQVVGGFRANRQFIAVYIHVDQGDYGPIDELMPKVKDALINGPKPRDLIDVVYLETSQDLQDQLLQTNFRYMRFQLIMAR
jgi:hypothetical protein